MFLRCMFLLVEGEACFSGRLCCRCCRPEYRRSSNDDAFVLPICKVVCLVARSAMIDDELAKMRKHRTYHILIEKT